MSQQVLHIEREQPYYHLVGVALRCMLFFAGAAKVGEECRDQRRSI